MTMPAQHESDNAVNTSDAQASRHAKDDGADDVVVDRPKDDDYDLLTFGEAGARLAEEVVKQRRHVDQLRADGVGDDQIVASEQRLIALQQAQERNRKPSLDELRESGFFGRRV